MADVFAEARQHIRVIRTLLQRPNRQNYSSAAGMLNQLALSLEAWKASLEDESSCSPEIRKAACELQEEMTVIRRLLEAPVHFFAGLDAAATAGFGAYERSGTVTNLGLGQRTLASL